MMLTSVVQIVHQVQESLSKVHKKIRSKIIKISCSTVFPCDAPDTALTSMKI
jgi:hypothetical protein